MTFLKKLYSKRPAENYQVFYMCNGCFEPIEELEHRYNCVDCIRSYDLCQKCHDSGKTTEHTDEMGRQHVFVVETTSRNNTATIVQKGGSLENIILNMFRYYKVRPAMGQYHRDKDEYGYLTFDEVFEMVKLFASGLKKLMSDKACSSSMISMCSIARLEWYLTDLACLLLGVPTVPLGAHSTKEQMKYILKKAEVSIIVCSSSTLTKLAKILPGCPTVQVVVLMDAAHSCSEGGSLEPYQIDVPETVHLMKFTDLMTSGRQHPTDLSKIKHKSNGIYTVQFTSGSTGDPKGCVFTRNTWKNRISRGIVLGYLSVWLSFHPPSHNLERGSYLITLLSGGKFGIYRGSMEHIFDDFALVRPTIVASTPRLWTMLYNQYLQALHEAYIHHQHGGESQVKEIPDHEVTETPQVTKTPQVTDTPQITDIPEVIAMIGEDYLSGASPSNPIASDSNGLAENFDPDQVPFKLRQEVMEHFKSKLGGRERQIATGGAPTGTRVKRFIMECFNAMVNDGYGSTEVGGIATDDCILSQSTVRLKDVPEMGYFITDNPPRGEICVKTPNMIDGYFKSPEITAEKFVDGYFLTGDIGVMTKWDKVRIIDRKKNIFKLAQGEFISPERLEALFVGASYRMSQMYIYGNSLQSNILAVVVPEPEGISKIAESLYSGKDIDSSISELSHLPEVKEIYMKELQFIAKENSLPGWEVPADIILEPCPFSMENGLLTSTLKKSRPNFEKKYKVLLEEMYQKLSSSNTYRPLELVVFEMIQKQLHSKMKEELPPKGDDEICHKSFSQLGGDSLAAMHLSSLLREHLSLEIPVDAILTQTLGRIISDISESSSISSSVAMVHDWKLEALIDSLLLDDCRSQSHDSFSDPSEISSSIFLTGCTGFLGRFVLWELLHDSQIARIFCLIQNKNGISGKNRIMSILRQLNSEMACCDGNIEGLDKMVVMIGDLSEPRLGLSIEDYTTICSQTDTILHNGARVNSALPYSALKKCNVESTKEIIKMSVTDRSKFLHYVSSIGVYPPMASHDHVDESVEPPMDRLDGLSGYSQSKWVAETLVLAAVEQGILKGNISRPGLIGPHTVTGHANLHDWVCWLMRGLVKLGMAPTGLGCGEDKQIHWIPVDQVAKAVVLLSCDHRGWTMDKNKNIFHLVNSNNPITFSALIGTLRSTHPSIKTTNYRDFRCELKKKSTLSGDKVLGSLDLLLPERGWPNSQRYCSEVQKVRRLEEGDIQMGQFNQIYAERYINYLIECNYI